MIFERVSGLLVDYWTEITVCLLTVLTSIVVFYKYKFTFWERHGFNYIKGSMPFACMRDFILGRLSISEVIMDVYKKGTGHIYVGYYSFWTPILLVRDPELIKKVMVKDFDYFYNRGMYYNDKIDPLSAHLFALEGVKWKTTRSKLNVSFSSGRIKQIFIIMKNCAIQLRDYVKESLDENMDTINFKELISRHSLNVIANSAVGMDHHTLKNESVLSKVAFKATEPTTVQGFRFILTMLSRDIARMLRMRFTPKEVETYYLDITKSIVENRTKNNIVRNDIMQQLIELWDKNLNYDHRPQSNDDHTLSLRDIAAQTFLFILAAYESNASSICFTLYELAKNQELQEKVHEEVDRFGPIEDLTYEQMLELKYLEMVLSETWRKYPPAGILFRECQKDYTLPDGKVLPKGVQIAVSALGLQRDPEYFPDPEKYDPERFNKENPSHSIQPFTFIAFGEGPRFCIGKRYGIINTKITLFTLMKEFRFELTDKTSGAIKLDPKTFVMQPVGGMYLKVISRR